MSDRSHRNNNNTRFGQVSGGHYGDEAAADPSTLQLQGTGTITALDLAQQQQQQNQHLQKLSWFRAIRNSHREFGKHRSANKQQLPLDSAKQHEGSKRTTFLKFGFGRTNKSKPHPEAITSLSASSNPEDTVVQEGRRASESDQDLPISYNTTPGTDPPRTVEPARRPDAPARSDTSKRYARHVQPVDPSSSASLNNEMLNRTTTDFLPRFKDQANPEYVEPLNIERVRGQDDPPDHRPRLPNVASVPREVQAAKSRAVFHDQARNLREPDGDDAKPRAMLKGQAQDPPEDGEAKPRAMEWSRLSEWSGYYREEHRAAPKKVVIQPDPPASEADQLVSPLKVMDPASKPLSQVIGDCLIRDLSSRVHNNIVKIVLVAPSSIDKSWLARHLSGSQPNASPQHADQEKTNLTVDVYDWRPSRVSQGLPDVKFSVWDVHGGTSGPDERRDIGFNPAVQSIFFSPGSLYLLVWDMAYNNPQCNNGGLSSKNSQSVYRSNRALRADIESRMLPWLDCIVQHFPGSAVLPVALVPPGMSDSESKTIRCQAFGKIIMEHAQQYGTMGDATRVDLLMKDSGDIVCVDSSTGASGVEHLQERIIAATADSKFLVRSHLGIPVPKGTIAVYRAILRLKQKHDYISLNQLLRGVEERVSEEEAVKALQVIANTGFVHFFASLDPSLSGFIFLDSLWLRNALSCILRDGMIDNFRNVLDWTKNVVMATCEEHDITSSLIGSKLSNCPLLSTNDVRALFKFMNSIHDASSMMEEGPKEMDGLYCFLERLFVQSGVLIPFQEIETQSNDFRQSVHFVPCLVLQIDPPNEMWTFMAQENYITTLCHTWLFREGVADSLMDDVSLAVLQALYVFVKDKLIDPVKGSDKTRRRRIHQIVCFKRSMVITIGSTFDRSETDTGDTRESFVQVFIGVVGQISPFAVATDVMDPGMQRLIIGGKGLCGCHGLRLWKGGLSCIIDSVRELLMKIPEAVPQVVCYECLARDSPKSASTWDWDGVVSAQEQGLSSIWCPRGHCVSSALLTGDVPDVGLYEPLLVDEPSPLRPSISILPRVVFVGVWDPDTKRMLQVGSGLLVDERMGLVVTAGHVLFELKDKTSQHFGEPYHGRPNGRAVIAVIPDAAENGTQAVFRYFAEIAAHDIPFAKILSHNISFVDACVLRISAKIEDTTHISALDKLGQPTSLSQNPEEEVCACTMSTEILQLEQGVRIFGFNQGGEGRYLKGQHISLSADVVFGKICRIYTPPIHLFDDRTGTMGLGGIRPSKVIVTTCPTIAGHSGGPCVTSKGHVIGILSMGDPAERTRSYVVPMSDIQPLIQKARMKLSFPISSL